MVLAGVLVGGGAAGYLVLRGDGDDSAAVSTDDTTADSVLSAEAGMAARAQRAQFAPGGGAGVAESATAKVAAGADTAAMCGPADGGDYTPTAEDLANANADTEAQAAVFDTYGVAYTRFTDELGYLVLQWDTNDVVAQSVSDSFWADRYPVPEPTQAELDKVKADNDVIARHLDEAGIAYTRQTDDSGWETITYDYDDPAAQKAADAAYAELYPPVPPTAEEKAAMTADNDKLAAALDEAGVAYTRKSDELGWEWIEWDYDDPAVQTKVDAVFAELYPVEGGAVCLDTVEGIAGGSGDGRTAVAPADASGEETPGDDGVAAFAEPTPEQIARRDAEAAALVDGFSQAGVRNELIGESPWQSVQFDITNKASVPVVADILAARPAV
ncbi:MAG: hypothetical protein OEY41_09225 [Acidimicrobiia bacterium]|nr:hypothetical protein [Acidimicrobiia bacterium]MDH5290169.1 hypothetical protein [Acidimicrobiia bacterium]